MTSLKILMVSEAVPARQLGGLAKHAVTLANALIEQGHQVSFMGLAGVDDEAKRKEMGFHGTFIGALEFMPGWKEAMLGCFNPWKRPFFAKRMAKIIAAHADGFDVVHYHGNLPLVAAYIPSHVNFVQTRHDQGSECLVHVRYRAQGLCRELDPAACATCATHQPNALQRWVSTQAASHYRSIAAKALAQHKTIFVSEAILNNARRVLPRGAFARSSVVHNFLDQPRLAQQTQGLAPSSDGGWQVIIASRLDEAKGVGPFLECWQNHQLPGARLLIVGDGPLRLDMERRFSSPSVHFLKHQPYDSTLKLTMQSHAAVVPSLCEESCSTTILEALFLERPCFALRRGGNPELVAYERWPGQLQLFDTMESLMMGLGSYLQALPDQPACTRVQAADNASDVRSHLHRIIQIYEE